MSAPAARRGLLLQGLALLVAVSCGVWLAVLWRWRVRGHAMSAEDFVLYLVLLPLVLFAALLLLRRLWSRGGLRGLWPAGGAPGAAAAPAAVPGPAAAQEQALRGASLQLLAAALRSACADTPAALLAAGSAGKPLPALDGELRNAEGLPVLAARIAELPMAADLVRHAREASAAGPSADPPARLPVHLARALAALDAPLTQALAAMRPWQPLFAAAATPRRPRLLVAWPAWWPARERALASAAVKARLAADAGLVPAAEQWRVECLAAGGAELWAEADRRWLADQREGRGEPLLLAAAYSDLSDDAVSVLEQQRRLFSPDHHPKGKLPSEAAAALLLAPADWPAAPGAAPDDPPPLRLQRPALMVRDKSIEAPGSVSSQALAEAVGSALAAAGLPAAEVAAVVCDADRHTPRATELFGLLLPQLPQLDPAEQVCMTGAVAGHGEAGALMVVAVAAERVRGEGRPCLALAQGDSHWRMALLLRPGAPPGPPPAAPSASPSTTPT